MSHHRTITLFRAERHVLSVHHTRNLIINGIPLAHGQFLHPSLFYQHPSLNMFHCRASLRFGPTGCSHALYLSSANTPARKARGSVFSLCPWGQILTHQESVQYKLLKVLFTPRYTGAVGKITSSNSALKHDDVTLTAVPVAVHRHDTRSPGEFPSCCCKR